MTYEVQQNRWDSLIRRVSGSIGPGSRVSETLSELFPVLDVERVPGELLVLGGTLIAQGAENRLGAGGQFAHVQLFNPAASGKLITVTQAIVTSSVAQRIRWGNVNVALGTQTNVDRFRDTRLGLLERPVGQIRNASLATVVQDTGAVEVLADTPLFLKDENSLAVLSPGFGFEFSAGTVATTIFLTFYWRERAAEASELSI